MSRHIPKVGGSKWNAALVEMRDRNRAQIEMLERLAQAANNDATRALIQEGIIRCYQNQLAIEELFKMK